MATTIFLVNPFTGSAPPPSPTYLLDTYSATTAYSLRQLKTGVTSVVRVRRSSDNSEQDFTATEVTDGTLTTFTGANDGFVVTWYDQSGNGNDATQSTAGNQAQLVSSGSVLTSTNGFPCLSFNGTSQFYDLTSAISNQDNMTFLSVFNRSSSSIVNAVFGRVGSGNCTIAWWRGGGNENFRLGTGGSTVIDSSNTSTGDFIHEIYWDGTNADLYKNGSSIGSTVHNEGTYDQIEDLGRNYLNYNSGNMQEAIVMLTDESANRADIESDINGYYSIY